MRSAKSGVKKQEAAEIGARLKKIRKESGLSLTEIAERLNREYGASTNKGMISKYENGIHEPSASTIFCLGRILGVSSDYILGKSEEKSPEQPQQGTDVTGHAIKVFTRYNPADGGDLDETAFEIVPKSWMVGGRDFFGIRIQGGRFAPRYYDGDIVIFERRSKTNRDQIGLVSVGDEDAFICLIVKKRDGKWIKPLDPAYSDKFYTTEEISAIPVKILGAAVQIRRMEYDFLNK
ncbi:MAG: helix-turn-helix domain-containing protein [Acutalibacteraceae bacterium]|nr:XRE family transcriptional regulator [Bacillota bacterium]